MSHSTGAWFMLLSKIAKHAGKLENLDIYFRNKATEESIDDQFDLNLLLKEIEPNNRNQIVVNLIVQVKGLVRLKFALS